MQCKHKRVFEGGNRVRKKPEEKQKKRRRREEMCEAKSYIHGPLEFSPFAFFLFFKSFYFTIITEKQIDLTKVFKIFNSN